MSEETKSLAQVNLDFELDSKGLTRLLFAMPKIQQLIGAEVRISWNIVDVREQPWGDPIGHLTHNPDGTLKE